MPTMEYCAAIRNIGLNVHLDALKAIMVNEKSKKRMYIKNAYINTHMYIKTIMHLLQEHIYTPKVHIKRIKIIILTDGGRKIGIEGN